MRDSCNKVPLSLVLGVAALLVTAPPAAADGNAITACIGPGGQIIHAAVGDEPWQRCPPNHVQETWGAVQGPRGLSCWDLNENGIADPDEDFNQDGVVDVRDCRPAEVYQPPTARTWFVASGASLAAAGYPPGEHHMVFYTCGPLDDPDPSCVADPVPDPCGLWYWDKEVVADIGEVWRLKATRGYQYLLERMQDWNTGGTEDPADDSFGWESCVGRCLNDAQCVGASITESGEDAIACRLIAKSQFDDPVIDEYGHLTGFTRDNWATIMYAWEWNFFTAIRNTVISVCPVDAP